MGKVATLRCGTAVQAQAAGASDGSLVPFEQLPAFDKVLRAETL